jgi:hypothetical protein
MRARMDGWLRRVVVNDDECWIWLGARSTSGYGNVTFFDSRLGHKRSTSAHRVFYEHFVAPIPEGLVIDHLCRVRACVNPDHLEVVTPEENRRRGLKGVMTTHCPRGHAYDTANTYVHRGKRFCRACGREGYRRRRSQGAEAAS